MTFPKNSYFAQHNDAVRHAQVDAMQNFQDRMVERAFEDQRVAGDASLRIRNWAANLSEALSSITDVDYGRKTAAAYAEAIERIDEIVREMDEYGR